MLNRFKQQIKNIKIKNKITNSPYFSKEWYKKTYAKELSTYNKSPLTHYLNVGWRLGFDPAPNFSTSAYLEKNLDVKEAGFCPLTHYIMHGIDEHREIGKNVAQVPVALPARVKSKNTLLFVINAYDKATQKYRVHNFVQPLQAYGWNVKVVQDKDVLPLMNSQWDIIVFNRIAAPESLVAAQLEYRKQGGILIYDIDDLIFNPDKARLQDSFKKRDIEGQNARLAAMAKIKSSALAADLMTVTTDALAQEANKMGQNAFVIPNSLPLQMPPAIAKQKDVINICYLSGTASHDGDFKECESALIEILNNYENVVFNLVGELALCEALDGHERIIRHELMSHNQMLQFLSSMDINLAPLELGNEFTECKSELKIFEAAYYGIPTVASTTAAFSDVINHSHNGFLASTSEDWFNALVELVENEKQRSALGDMAKKTIAAVFHVKFISAKLHAFYSYLLANKERSLAQISSNDVYQHVCANKPLQIELVKHSAIFDESEYKRLYPDLAKVNGSEHYIGYGSKESRKPSNIFDAWWYDISQGHYNSADSNYNPVLHALFHAKGNNCYLSSPRAVTASTQYFLPLNSVKRACLFAGYDADGLIDATAIKYIAELAKYCDVYYLADCEILDVELAKLTPFVKGAWAERHANYDFGSYKTLLTEKLGWEAAEQYDEIIFANDSVYLLTDLSAVFAKMDKSNCAWWGMQATKGMAFTKDHPSQNHVSGTTHVLNDALFSEFDNTPYYDFLVGSYFIVFRKNVVQDAGFRKIIESISFVNKKKLILDYEVGISRYLIGKSFQLETFIEELHAFHPVYTENLLHLINNEGFPFLKRYLLANNHYFVPQLGKLLETYDLLNDVDMLAHLQRTVGDKVLTKNLNLSLLDAYKASAFDKLSAANFQQLDNQIIKDPNLWIFPVCFYDHLLTGNDRAVFEEVKNDPRIRKVVLTRSKQINLSGVNVHFYDIDSAEAQQIILRAKNIFLKHGPRINIPYPCEYNQRNFINLWHGIPLKRIGISSLDGSGERFNNLVAHNKPNRCVISSSKVDRLAMTAGFYPLTYNDIPVTGLPRIDFITMPESELPEDMQQELSALREKLAGKKLALYAPTFRNAQDDAYFSFNTEQLSNLQSLLNHNNTVLGVREHMADTTKSYNEVLSEIGCLNFSAENVINIEMLYRVADVLITDYSSCYIDYLATRKPVISFAYDLESYMNEERGFYYDIHEVFPGPVCTTFETMLIELSNGLSGTNIDKAHYERVRSQFFDFDDELNSQRVVELVHSLG